MPSSPEKKCIIVLGMHRSGTSSLTGALHLTGFDLGKNLMPPADENPKGFFENLSIVNLNDRILAELYNFWSDTLLLPEGWWSGERFTPHARKAMEIMDEEFSGDKPMLIKDPRLCIVLPVYLGVFRSKGINPFFLICVRDPSDVARSLGRRNNMPTEKSALLWMDYQLRAERYSRGYGRMFVSYRDLLEHPLEVIDKIRQASGMGFRMDEPIQQEIKAFLDPSLSGRGSKHAPPEPAFPLLDELYQLQLQASRRDFDLAGRSAADRINTEFIRQVRFFHGIPGTLKAALTLTYEDNRIQSLEMPVGFGQQEVCFEWEPGARVREMVLRPCNARVGLKMSGAKAWLHEGAPLVLQNFIHNAGAHNHEGIMLFDTDLPKVIFRFDPPLAIQRVGFSLDYLVFGTISCRKAMKKQTAPPARVAHDLPTAHKNPSGGIFMTLRRFLQRFTGDEGK